MTRGSFERTHGGAIMGTRSGELPSATQAGLRRTLPKGQSKHGRAEQILWDARFVGAVIRYSRSVAEQGEFRKDRKDDQAVPVDDTMSRISTGATIRAFMIQRHPAA